VVPFKAYFDACLWRLPVHVMVVHIVHVLHYWYIRKAIIIITPLSAFYLTTVWVFFCQDE